jgi:hypothetical protein
MKNVMISLLVFFSCNTEYEIFQEKEDIEILETEPGEIVNPIPDDSVADDETPLNEPDIEIEFSPLGTQTVKVGCESSGQFKVKNVGTADLVVSDLDSYASVPSNVTISSPYAPLPLTIAPGDHSTIEFDVLASDSVDDIVFVVAKSNDPDEPVSFLDATYGYDIGATYTEAFTIEESKEADILMIVDNSCSMTEEQSELSSNSELFIDKLDSLMVDYRIAVITTDDDRFVGPVITPLSVDPSLELSTQVNVGTAGSPDERGILFASKALSPAGMAAPGGSFLRADARLSIVWISDEDDFSGGSTSIWASDFWSKKSSPGEVSVWGIIGDPFYGCVSASPGNIYDNLIVSMGGSWTSICASDWGIPLASVAGSVGIDSTLELSRTPIASTINVIVSGVVSYDWVYVIADNSISFNPGHIPAVGSSVEVSYSIYEDCINP